VSGASTSGNEFEEAERALQLEGSLWRFFLESLVGEGESFVYLLTITCKGWLVAPKVFRVFRLVALVFIGVSFTDVGIHGFQGL